VKPFGKTWEKVARKCTDDEKRQIEERRG